MVVMNIKVMEISKALMSGWSFVFLALKEKINWREPMNILWIPTEPGPSHNWNGDDSDHCFFFYSDNDENDDAHENGDFCLDPTQVWRL